MFAVNLSDCIIMGYRYSLPQELNVFSVVCTEFSFDGSLFLIECSLYRRRSDGYNTLTPSTATVIIIPLKIRGPDLLGVDDIDRAILAAYLHPQIPR